jgi:hypothetical protein
MDSHLARKLRRRFDDEVVAVVDDHEVDFWQRTYLTRNAITAAHTQNVSR